MKKLSNYIKNTLLVLASVGTFLLISMLFDRFVLGLYVQKQAKAGLVFPPQTETYYYTPEFSFTAKINSLGFRGREFSPDNKKSVKILAIGNSMTYGWGVEENRAWPHVLEDNLSRLGCDVEVANLGQPGGYPATYAKIAEKAIPVLKPDLVIVAVLQGHDLAKIKKAEIEKGKNGKDKSILFPSIKDYSLKILYHSYPNLYTLTQKYFMARKNWLRDTWKVSVKKKLIDNFSIEEKSRFEKLDKRVKDALINGELNPALIYNSIKMPDYFLQTFDINRPDALSLISDMGQYLSRIKETAIINGSNLIVVAVPFGPYMSHRDYQSWQLLGYNLMPEIITSNSADEAIELACKQTGVRFISVTSEFRQRANLQPLFFELDQHFNSEGSLYFANLLTPLVKKIMDEKLE